MTRESKKLLNNPWKPRYAVLIGGSLFFYKDDSETAELQFALLLKEAQLESSTESNREHTFGIKTKEDHKIFALENAEELASWLEAISASLGQDPANPPNHEAKKKLGVLANAKKNMSGKLATSAMGKKIMQKVMDDEVKSYLATLYEITSTEYGKDVADAIQKNVIKLMIKGYWQLEERNLVVDDFRQINQWLRQSFCHMMVFRNKPVTREQITESLTRASNILNEIRQGLIRLLKPFLSEKNLVIINEMYEQLGSVDFLVRVYTNPQLVEPIKMLDSAFMTYLQNWG